MRILAFGHIPSWAGGRQEQGLANVIYNLALHLALCADVEVALGATDVCQERMRVGNLLILGWRKLTLMKYALRHPFFAIRFFFHILRYKSLFPHYVSVLRDFLKGVHLRRCIQSQQPDLVHLHGASSILYHLAIPQHIKVVTTIHGLVGNDTVIKNHKEFAGFESRLCQNTRLSKIYFIASRLVEDFQAFYGQIQADTEVIPNAYNPTDFYCKEPSSRTKLTLFTLASIQPRKGQQRVAEAIRQTSLPYQYLCAGAATPEAVKELQTTGIDFRYLGTLKPAEICETFAGVDYMILASSSEGFGLVFLEAMACGVPVILPKNLPIVQEKDIIKPGVNALLLEDASTASIAQLLPSLRAAHFDRQRVAASVCHCSWEGAASRYAASLKKLAERL